MYIEIDSSSEWYILGDLDAHAYSNKNTKSQKVWNVIKKLIEKTSSKFVRLNISPNLVHYDHALLASHCILFYLKFANDKLPLLNGK